uniref:Uncharacterized protein n=1 Tax=Trichogramma kaykai TaxID=54128 RepID=A0ABD2VSH8_9HYME
MLKKGANPNLANVDGLTPLHTICQRDKDDDLLEKFFETNNNLQQTVQIDALDKLGRTPLQRAVVSFLPHVVDVLLGHGADLSGFVFPTARHFDEGFKSYNIQKISFKLILASGSLTVFEVLENRGYELDQSDALIIMTLFSKYELFKKSACIVEHSTDEKYMTLSSSSTKITMMNASLSLYDLILLRPKDAPKLLTYQDFLEFAHFEQKWYSIIYWQRKNYEIHLCEKLSRGFFRAWALECFMELTHCRLPFECCEMIIDESFMNKDLYDICLSAKGQSSR